MRTASRALSAVVAALLASLFAVNAAHDVGRWSGDALIHLTLAERLAGGQAFEFNAGELTSASSSLGFTALEGLIFRLFGARAVAYGVPAIALGSLLGAAALVGLLARRLGAGRGAAALGALAFLALPGVARNGALPMEAGAFAAAALGFALSLEGDLRRPPRLLLSAGLLAVAALIRPEGALLAALPWVSAPSRARAAAVTTLAALAVAPVLWIHHSKTGLLLPGSAVSRVMAARRSALSMHVVGPFWIYGAALARLGAYLPLAALGAQGARGRSPLARRLGALLALGLSLYTFATGAFHAGRLMIWLFAALCALAPAAAERALGSARGRVWLFVGAVGFLGVAVGETIARSQDPPEVSGGLPAGEVVSARERRAESTDELLSAICSGGCCHAGQTPRIGAEEVQIRWALDDRIAVVSLDGRTRNLGGASVSFSEEGCVDLEAVLEDAAVVALLDFPRQGAKCPARGQARALGEAFGGAAAAPGWRWESGFGALVRVCLR